VIRVGVIGAGLIGRERLDAVKRLSAKGLPVAIAGVYDMSAELTRKAAAEYQTEAHDNLDSLLAADNDLVVIALPHDTTVPIALKALEGRGDVLIEKPLGRDLREANLLAEAGGNRLKVGFNYRFYPGIRKAIVDARKGRFGEMISVEFQLGHGCAPGQEKTWKLNAERAGGGCLIDPGIHLLDLCLLLSPDGLDVAGGSSWSGFWKTGIEEEVNLVLRGRQFSIALHVSIVQWRSLFRMAVHGTEGYGVVAGRNRSYGPQTYRFGPRWGWQNAPSQAESETVEVESDGMSVFADEMEALLFPSDAKDELWPAPVTAADALRVMQLLDEIRRELNLPRDY
jgi:1,5-anhydro-D-fructose reductase (1,5-anhydro-D-mannitol-forming)